MFSETLSSNFVIIVLSRIPRTIIAKFFTIQGMPSSILASPSLKVGPRIVTIDVNIANSPETTIGVFRGLSLI